MSLGCSGGAMRIGGGPKPYDDNPAFAPTVFRLSPLPPAACASFKARTEPEE
jgi:hypothetical protein